jgi:3-oxoacyl-[acyl-carrier protein] reductase
MGKEDRKVAMVTGASRGIGAAIASRLAADGFALVLNYAGSDKEAAALAARIEADGGRALTAQADVSDPQAVRRMFDAAEAALGGVDVLVYNAGIMRLAPLADSDDALIGRQIAVNLQGSLYTLREAARRLRDDGRIVNLSSSVVGMNLPTYGVFATGGVEGEGRSVVGGGGVKTAIFLRLASTRADLFSRTETDPDHGS